VRNHIAVALLGALALVTTIGCARGPSSTVPGRADARAPAGSSAERVEVPKNGHAPSGSCDAAGRRVSWDESSRRFEIGDAVYVLDERGRPVEKTDRGGTFRHAMRNDEHGTLSELRYFYGGVEAPENSYDILNTYDAEGALVSATHRFRKGGRVGKFTYERAGGHVVRKTMEMSAPGAPDELGTTRYRWDGNRMVELTVDGDAPGTYRRREVATYEGAKLTRLSQDGNGIGGGADGKPDAVFEWTYDDAGRCIRLTVDTTQTDSPVADGHVDQTRTFEPRCAAIAMLPRELYWFPDWYDP